MVDIKTKIHNKFEVEVFRDGKLIKTAEGYNTLTNRMFERLCNGLNYFYYILFGGGTGTPSVADTALFNKIGHKQAEVVEFSYAAPTSYVKKKITLNPEEYIGQAITEMGICDSLSYINSHAILKDAEGNPISINKTASDVVIIYATIFVTFTLPQNVVMEGLKDRSNLLLYWLLSKSNTATAPRNSFFLALFAGGKYIATKSSGDTIADVENKKITFGPVRFGITEGNHNILSVGHAGSLQFNLPMPSVFDGQAYTGISLGAGDGIKTEFLIPSQNLKSSTLAIKKDGVTVTDYTTEPRWSFLGETETGVELLPGRDAVVTGASDGSFVLAVEKEYNYPRIRLLESEDGFETARDLGAPISDTGDELSITFYGCACDSNFTRLAYPEKSGTKYAFAYYSFNKTTKRFSKIQPQGIEFEYVQSKGMAMSRDGTNFVFIESGSNPYQLHFYTKNEQDVFTKTKTILSQGYDILGFSTDCKKVVTRVNYRCFVYNEDETLPQLPEITLSSAMAFDASPDFDFVVVSKKYPADTSKSMLTTFDLVDGNWIEHEMGVLDSFRGLNVIDRNSFFIGPKMYTRVNGEFVSEDNPTQKIYYPSPFTTEWNYLSYEQSKTHKAQVRPNKTLVKFNTPPAAGAAITADYTVEGIHKTDQYVIDVGFSIQFGEG